METLSDKMKNEARQLGLCDEWFSQWEDNSPKGVMIDKFIKGIDFCVEHNFPSTNDMLALFGRNEMSKKGVYVNEEVLLNDPSIAVLNGKCTGKISYEGFSAGEVHVRHNSVVCIDSVGNSRVRINVYDDAVVNVSCGVYAKVFVYRYGGKVSTSGNVCVRDRENFYAKV